MLAAPHIFICLLTLAAIDKGKIFLIKWREEEWFIILYTLKIINSLKFICFSKNEWIGIGLEKW